MNSKYLTFIECMKIWAEDPNRLIKTAKSYNWRFTNGCLQYDSEGNKSNWCGGDLGTLLANRPLNPNWDGKDFADDIVPEFGCQEKQAKELLRTFRGEVTQQIERNLSSNSGA